MVGAIVDLAVMAGATVDRETVALRIADLADRAIVVPMALVVSGADPTVLLLAARDLAARMVVLAVDPVVRMVPVAGDRIMVPALVAKADLMDAAKAVPMAVVPMVPAGVAGVVLALVVPEVLVVRAEGIWNTGWIKSTASSTKSSARLSP